MNEEEAQFMEDESFRSRLQNEQMQQEQQVRLLEEQNKGIIKEQLNLEEEFERIDHLLRGHVKRQDSNGESFWEEPKSNDEILLSEAGINLIIKMLRWYLNKNTLLSNYDEETILSKMEDLSTSLADALFMNYEKYFLYPTLEDCQEKLIQRLKKKQQDILYTYELQGEEVTEEEVWNQLVGEINPSIERQKIKEQLIKDKLKLYDLLMRQVQDSVHSAYLRAYAGQERKTLRQHINISEVMGHGGQQKGKEEGGFFRKR